jgi:hypothetical protein
MQEAARMVSHTAGIDLQTAMARVEAALAVDATPAPARPSAWTTVGDYFAASLKFPLALALALGAGTAGLWLGIELMPHVTKYMDSGLFMLAMLGVPMIVCAIASMTWARRWRRRREQELLAPAPPSKVPMQRARFGGLPDPGGALPPQAMAALDRRDVIGAVKIVREQQGLGLTQAKHLIDAELARRK